MPLSQLPLELLIIIAHYITDSRGKCRYADLNSLVLVNRAFYVCLNTILWQQALSSSDKTARIFLSIISGATKNPARLNFFLELGADIETRLCDFCYYNHFPRFLISTPLVVAVREDNVPMARLLLGKGAKVRNRSSSDCGVMHAAQSAEMVKLLLDHHADPEEEDGGFRPLHIHTELLDRDEKENGSFRPLHTYTVLNDIAMMRVVLQGGAEVDAVTGEDGATALHLAVQRSVDAVKLLLEFGADFKKEAQLSNTSWHLAAAAGKTDVLRLLIELWPEGLRKRGQAGATPLHFAVESGMIDAVRLLVQLWPEALGAKAWYGDTPLHGAATKGMTDMARLFLQTRPEGIRAKNNSGNTPLYRAAMAFKIDMVRLLVERWPEGKEELNEYRQTPLSGFLDAGSHMDREGKEDIISLLGGVC